MVEPSDRTNVAGQSSIVNRQLSISRRLWGLLSGQRIRPLLILTVGWYLIFAGFRVGLLIAYRDSLSDVSAGTLLKCFLVGMQFDGVSLGIVALPLVLALSLAPDLAFGLRPSKASGRPERVEGRWFRRLIAAYVALALTSAVLIEIIGACFFVQYSLRLNWVAIDYLQFYRELFSYIYSQYPMITVAVGIVALTVGLYWALMRIFQKGAAPAGPIWSRPILMAMLVGLCVMAIRGSFDHKPLRIGTSGISDNNVVNQLALNNFFSLGSAVRSQMQDSRSEANWYPFPPSETARAMAVRMLYQDQDVDMHRSDNPLWRRTVTGRPLKDYNVVVIIMEGMAGKPVGVLGNTPGYTPIFDQLCREGAFFGRMYGVGTRTNRGIVGTLCGYPDLGGRSVMLRSRAIGQFLTLPGCLRDRGYKTLFAYGGKPAWDNIQGFFSRGGIEEFIGQVGGLDESGDNPWGMPDLTTFRRVHERLLSYGDRKFFAAVMTISNHEPFIPPPCPPETLSFPNDTLEHRKLNCYRYADWAIGRFFSWARQASYFKNTIFVLVADHGRDFVSKQFIDVPGFHIPCVIYAPGIVPAQKISTICSQTDIAPTVLSLLGGQFDHCFMGRNILAARPNDGFALLHVDTTLGFVNNDGGIVAPREEKPTVVRVGDDKQETITGQEADALRPRLQEEMLSYYSMARQLYLDASYCPPAKAVAVPVRVVGTTSK